MGMQLRRGLVASGWLSFTSLIVALDYLTGPDIRFPVLVLLPIGLVAWFHRPVWSILLAILLPAPRAYFEFVWGAGGATTYEVANAAIRGVVYLFIAVLISTVVQQRRKLEHEVRTLRGILPICMFCKRIRNDHDEWEQLESYVSHRSEAEFSHGLCADCAQKHYPTLLRGGTPRA